MPRSWGRLLAKIAGYGFLVLVLLAALGITFTVGWRPVIGAKKRALTSRKFEVTPARLQRSDYLVHAVMHCMGCHSKHDEKANPPVLAAQEGSGQVLFEQGDLRLVAPNITSDPETGHRQVERRRDRACHPRRHRCGRKHAVSAHALRTLPRLVRRRPGFHRGIPAQRAAGAQ